MSFSLFASLEKTIHIFLNEEEAENKRIGDFHFRHSIINIDITIVIMIPTIMRCRKHPKNQRTVPRQ
jgi:hypothetical protein